MKEKAREEVVHMVHCKLVRWRFFSSYVVLFKFVQVCGIIFIYGLRVNDMRGLVEVRLDFGELRGLVN